MSELAPGRPRRSSAGRPRRPATSVATTAGIVLAIALAVSIVGSVVTFFELRAAFAQHNAIDQAQQRLSALFRLQLEEETGLRGFLTSGERLYLAPFDATAPRFDEEWTKLRAVSVRAHLQTGDVLLTDLRRTHDRWAADIAAPLIAQPSAPDAIGRLSSGKALSDRMETDFEQLSSLYEKAGMDATEVVQSQFVRAAASTAALILVFGFAAMVADHYRTRTQLALDRERVVADTLQRAFSSGWDALPNVRVGTAYVSSTRDAAVGGDLFDIHRVDDARSLVLVADVSGKGLGAAVETAQVKYAVRALAAEFADPADVLDRFNKLFCKSSRDPSSFVTLFVGVLDAGGARLRYASAGHAPTFLRRAVGVSQLAVTGPVIGLESMSTFESRKVDLAPGDMLVLATDGLTEARDNAGVPVNDDGVMRWIAAGERQPELLASELVRRVERFCGGRINDDLALLILRIDGAPQAPDGSPQPAAGAGRA